MIRPAGIAAAASDAALPAARAASGQAHPPVWVRDAIFYQVFPERFADGNPANNPFGSKPWETPPDHFTFVGGDLDGIAQNLDWIEGVGANSLYLNPIAEAASNHGYDITDYYKVREAFGGEPALRRLVSGLHGRDMRIILDGVFNHTSHQSTWFRDVIERGPESPYWSFYEVDNWPIRFSLNEHGIIESPDYHGWFGHDTLPELNTKNPEVRNRLIHDENSVIAHWMREFGIDGWRMDAADEVELDFWAEARQRIKEINPDAYMLAEAWGDTSDFLGGDTFDGAMNYHWFRTPAREFFAYGNLSVDQYIAQISNSLPTPTRQAMFNILASHDTPRLVTEAGGDWFRARPAVITQFAWEGTPVVYYGDEIGMEGGVDPRNRMGFDWPAAHAAQKVVDSGGGTTADAGKAAHMLWLHRTMADIRTQTPALRHGTTDVLMTHNDNRTFAFRRAVDGNQTDAIVAVNASSVGHDVSIPVRGFAEDGTRYLDALSGAELVVADGQLVTPAIDGNFGAVLIRQQ